ncbi:hypothetical protein AAY473_001329 [Plecturocebus cupreus]
MLALWFQHNVNEVEVTDSNPLPSGRLQRLMHPWLLRGLEENDKGRPNRAAPVNDSKNPRGGITRSEDRHQPGQHEKSLSLLKIQKLVGRGGRPLKSQLLKGLRREDRLSLGGGGCSELRSCHCTPAWTTRARHSLEKRKERKRNIRNCFALTYRDPSSFL